MNELDILEKELEQVKAENVQLLAKLAMSDTERDTDRLKEQVSKVFDKSIFRLSGNREAIQAVIDELKLGCTVGEVVINSDKKTGLFDRDSIITSIMQLSAKE